MKYFLACFLFLITIDGFSQKQQALIISIDNYGSSKCDETAIDGGGRKVCNLYGCNNDGLAIKSLITTKYGFKPAAITSLTDQAATRSNILNAMGTLLRQSNRGDYAFIYYAGHGSQVINSKSRRETDKMDESIVPADTKKAGILDIRDKELNKVFNAFLDKGIHLTVIFDCCNSSSMSRGGMYEENTGRYAEPGKEDVKDPSNPLIPEYRTNTKGSFLIFSSAQDDQIAQELRDANNQKRGAFTYALVAALNQLSVNTSAGDILKSVKTILMNNGKTNQDPSMAGSIERQQQTLFGFSKGKLTDRMLIPVSGVKNGNVAFLAGFAQGLAPGNELSMASTNTGATRVKVKLETINGINSSTGKIISGSAANVKPGALFEVSNWVSPTSPLLKLCILPNNYSYAEVAELNKLATQIKQSGKVNWIDDLTRTDPYMIVMFMNNNGYTHTEAGGIKELGQLTVENISRLAGNRPVYFNMPAPAAAVNKIKEKLSRKNILFTNNLWESNYFLYGTLNEDNNPAYGWRSFGIKVKDSLSSLPAQTGNIALRNESTSSYEMLGDNLSEYAMRLAKVRYWVMLAGPKVYDNEFPFQLKMVDGNTKREIGSSGAKVGSAILLKLDATRKLDNKVKEKFVYVFTLDSEGGMQLIFPDEKDGNQRNKFPMHENFKSWGDWVSSVELAKLKVGEPVGTDNYFLIATEQQIPDYALLFNQEGIGASTRGVESNQGSPFAAIMDIENEGISGRGNPPATPANWNLLKLSVKTRH